jgi:ADP-heptose:LPS heptosyltransferase
VRNVRRLLFLQYETALGTAVHATPVFEALRKAVPNAHITVLSSGVPYEVLKNNPYIDALISTPHPVKEWLAAVRFFLTKVRPRRHEFDCVITDSGNRRSRFQLLSILAAVRYRIGFEARYNFNHASIAYDACKSILHNNLRLVSLFGHPYDPVEPTVFFTAEDVLQVTKVLKGRSGSPSGARVAFQTQTSGGEPNQWFEDRFIELADALYRKTDAHVIFVGASSEVGRIESIRNNISAPSFSAAGRTSIPELAALLSMCDLLVTLDTGTMHVGRAVKVPMVVIAHGKAPEHEWLPPAAEHIRILRRTDVDCTPCRTAACVTRECMRRIQVGDVLDATIAHLQKFPPSLAEQQTRVAQSLRPVARTCTATGW